MGDHHQYGPPDLRRFLPRRTHFPTPPSQPSEPYQLAHRSMASLAPYHEALMLNSGMSMLTSDLFRFSHDHFVGASSTTGTAAAAATSGPCAALFGAEMESSGWNLGNMDGGNCRWPRQETLTLLEIRSRLDSKFKEANQKGPLWDEVSRIMAEEYGYQRSGKKCREKFENLYKYYKKTKADKAGRQDGKHYRFFRQLEAIYGETSNQSSVPETNLARTLNNAMDLENQDQTLQEQKTSESRSLSHASEFATSSSENCDDHDLSAIAFMMKHSMENNKSGSKLIGKVKDIVESQMKNLIDSQDVWMERMLKTIEDKENERMSREEEWRRLEAARFDKEHEIWAKERAWFEARDAALMEVVKKITGKGLEVSSLAEAPVTKIQTEINTNRWTEHEISSLLQLRTSLEPKFNETGYSKQSLWEEIEAKMLSLGYEREAIECEQKWDNMQMCFNVTNAERYKKRKEDFSRSINYFQQPDCFNGEENESNYSVKQRADQAIDSSSPSNSYDISSFHIASANQRDERFWDRYAQKLSKGKNKQI